MKGKEVFIVIPEPLSGLFPRLMPELGKPIRARKFPSRMRTFYLIPVYDPEEKRERRSPSTKTSAGKRKYGYKSGGRNEKFWAV